MLWRGLRPCTASEGPMCVCWQEALRSFLEIMEDGTLCGLHGVQMMLLFKLAP